MDKKNFNKGVLLTSLGSFWWGFFGVIYFKYISFAGHIEVLVHRSFWTFILLIITTILFAKWNFIIKIFNDKKKIFILIVTSLLIVINWGVWIYAVGQEKIIDASFGYFIMPIISVFLGNFFFKETITTKGRISIFLVIISVIFLIIIDFKSIPWVGLIVAFSWSFYNLLRKKINVETDIGLLIESLFILPFVIIAFYFISLNNYNDFSFSNPALMSLLMLAGPMTVIPLFLYVRGVELAGLGPAGMIFYITPTLQFLLGFFIYNEQFNINQLVSFILIWFAVFIYLKDIYEKN